MKKLFKSVAVLAAALAVGMLASCKMNEESGGGFGDVTESVTVKEDKVGYVIMDLIGEPAVTWYKWTSGTKGERGPIVEPGTVGAGCFEVYAAENIGKKEYKIGTKVNNNNESLDAGKVYAFKLPEGEYNFYYYQSAESNPKSTTNKNNIKDKNGKADENYDLDRVGYLKIDPRKNTSIHLNDKDWKYVNQQGAVYLTLNEPYEHSFFNSDVNNGNYDISQVLPLIPVEGVKDQYQINEKLKYNDLNFTKGQTKGFLFPKGSQTITTLQPKRGQGNLEKFKIRYVEDKKGNLLYVTKNENITVDGINLDNYPAESKKGERKITQKDIDFKNLEFWGADVNVEAHKDTGKITLNKAWDNLNTEQVSCSKNIPAVTSLFPKKFIKTGSKYDKKSALDITIVEEATAEVGEK